MVEAAGGLDSFKNVNSVNVRGTVTLVMGQQELPVSMSNTQAYPDRFHQEMNLMGQVIHIIRDGSQGWKTDQKTMEIVPMTEADFADADRDMARDRIYIIQHFDDPYYQAVYESSGKAGDYPVEWVALIDEAGEPICRLGICPNTHQMLARSHWGKTFAGEGTVIKTYSNFKAVNGVQVPMTTITHMNGQRIMQTEIAECTINSELPTGVFAKPQ